MFNYFCGWNGGTNALKWPSRDSGRQLALAVSAGLTVERRLIRTVPQVAEGDAVREAQE